MTQVAIEIALAHFGYIKPWFSASPLRYQSKLVRSISLNICFYINRPPRRKKKNKPVHIPFRLPFIPVCAVSSMPRLSFNVKRVHSLPCHINQTSHAVLQEERAVFIQSFFSSYSAYPEGTIKLPPNTTLQKFLGDAFEEEEAAFKIASNFALDDLNAPHRFYNATVLENGNHTIAAYLSVDVLDGGRTSYLRQLAVLPEYQKAGIARALVQYSINDLPDLLKVTVSYRNTNTAAAAFYHRFGFVDMDHCHSTLNPDLYSGLAWYK